MHIYIYIGWRRVLNAETAVPSKSLFCVCYFYIYLYAASIQLKNLNNT